MRFYLLAFTLLLSTIGGKAYAGSNPAPFIGQPLVPGSVRPGARNITLSVSGSGFVSGSIVQWNGQALITQFKNRESLTAAVPASLLAKPVTAIVTVVNPSPGGGVSNSSFFEVTQPTPSAIMFEIRTNTSAPTNSLVAGDFNGDGKLDLAVSTGSSLSVLLGNGDGTFNVTKFPTTAQFVGTLVAGDFNGDGKLDLAFPDPYNNLLHLMLGNGDGTFSEVSTTGVGNNPVWAAAGDFNGDGKLDLAVVNQAGRNVSILLGNGNGTFKRTTSVAVGKQPNAVVVADLNGDGELDLAVVNSGSNTVSVLLGAGNGTFNLKSTPSTGSTPYGIVASDFNGDGKVDLAVTNTCGNGTTCDPPEFGSVSILMGAGDGTFTVTSRVLTNYHKPLGIAAGDFNADGKTDLVVVGLTESSALVLLGDGNGDFRNPIPMNGFAPPFAGYVAVGDFNGDGRLDFAENNPSDVGGIQAVSVQTQSAVACYPAVVSFPPQPVGTSSPPKDVRFRNIGTVPVNISNIQAVGYYGESNNCPVTLPIGSDCTISVTFTPESTDLSGGLVLVTDDALGVRQSCGLVGRGK